MRAVRTGAITNVLVATGGQLIARSSSSSSSESDHGGDTAKKKRTLHLGVHVTDMQESKENFF